MQVVMKDPLAAFQLKEPSVGESLEGKEGREREGGRVRLPE